MILPELAEKQKIGDIGENIAARFLENKGFRIIERNYRKKYGEIDIIAQNGKTLHFIEVKSVSCENLAKNWRFRSNKVSSGTDQYRPEDNIHPQKMKRLARTIQAYLLEKHQDSELEWIFDAVTVRIDVKNRDARVKFLENLVL